MQVGPYRIVEELARGGAGIVFRAEDEAGDPVALKLLHSARLSRSLSRKRFLAEAQALARLQHPHVIRYRGSGQQDGMPWLALDFVEGESLQRRLDAGPLPVWKAIRIAQQLASALRYVHGCGVLHRDLKPDNVLLRGDEALLTDFGLVLDEEAEQERLTQTGAFLGTPGYGSPEQARGEKERIGPATDVYGWGAVLYACLTGAPPMEADSLPALVASIGVRRIPPPHELRKEVPRWLSQLCMRCLAVDPQARPESMEAVGRALIRGPQQAQAGGARRLRRLLLGVALLAVASLTALSLVLGRGPSASERATALNAEAKAHLTGGRFAEALAACDAAIALDPQRASFHVNRGSAKVELGRLTEALDDYARALELGSTSVSLRLNRARALWELDRFEEALVDLDAALELDPDSVTGRVSRAGTLFYLGRFEESLADFARALELEPDRLPARTSRAEVFSRLGRPAEALEDLEHAVGLRPEDPRLRLKRARAALGARRFRLALSDLDWLLARTEDRGELRALRANALEGLGERRAALEELERATRLEPEDAGIRAELARARVEAGRVLEGLADYDRALELDPSSLGARLGRADVHALRGDVARALTDFDRAAALWPGEIAVWRERGKFLLKLRRYEPALRDGERGLALDPRDEVSHLTRCLSLLQMERFEDALAACDAMVRQRPDLAMSHGQRGVTLYSVERFAEAIDRALELGPSPGEVEQLRDLRRRARERLGG